MNLDPQHMAVLSTPLRGCWSDAELIAAGRYVRDASERRRKAIAKAFWEATPARVRVRFRPLPLGRTEAAEDRWRCRQIATLTEYLLGGARDRELRARLHPAVLCGVDLRPGHNPY